jgi:cation diffusion facilitator family transporter
MSAEPTTTRSRTAHEDSSGQEVRRVTWVGLVINLCLSAMKIFAGVVGHSQAVVADGIHSLSDITTDVAILVGVRYWTRPADATHPHGHRRVEILVAIAIGFVLAIVATGILWNAIVTLPEPHSESPEWAAVIVAFLSIVSKEILFRWTISRGRRIKSTALVANAWHHRSDALSSIPVVVAVGGAILQPAWYFLDHAGAILVSLFIYHAAYGIIRPEIWKLTDSGAPREVLERIERIASETPNVRQVHHIRTRYVGSTGFAVDLHIRVDATMSVREGHDVSEAVNRRLLEEGPDIVDVVVHLEPCRTGPTLDP